MTNAAESADHSSQSTKRVITWVTRAIGYLVYAYLVFVEIILLLGFFLLLFGANPSSGFVEWAYRNLDRVMEPFRGIFSPIEIGTTGNDVPAIFETSILFAMVIYGIIAILLKAGIDYLTRTLNRIDREEQEEHRRQAYSDAIRRSQSPLDPTIPQTQGSYPTVTATPVPPEVAEQTQAGQATQPGQAPGTQQSAPLDPPSTS